MKKLLNKLKLLLIIGMITIPGILLAQPPGGDDDDVTDVPFDGGVSLLVAAGIGYGLKKAHDKKKAEKKEILQVLFVKYEKLYFEMKQQDAD